MIDAAEVVSCFLNTGLVPIWGSLYNLKAPTGCRPKFRRLLHCDSK